ncbi:hypothetical protein M271_39785 [Streptomyces rapamycinicus NRRL 5491]|uniref:Type IV secretion protein Rhs n=2 Tax=Streptomyces rapamycinicus TaxID=1226757 RepID=A0A0A0NSJ1_STRRN|nr:hypothetical protein M271_39785 [Streptomyces rapamycinicus NRRL 5491]MBB4787087.1 YD repeat-containing protein [Streptomyces rapamycinicus]RLV77472.1 hypothetical protein D3C57_103845 [Streptomyces rapamycinicus NRRL 5491]
MWQWDTEGNLARHTDQAGHTTSYTHTHFDLPATRTDPDIATYAFTYDTELRLTAVTNPQGRQWHYEYDAAGRLVAETDFNGAQRTYERDAAGRLTAHTNSFGETQRYTLDTAGRILLAVGRLLAGGLVELRRWRASRAAGAARSLRRG